MSLVTFTKAGLYVPEADVYIDPTHRVSKALITHGHSDHSRWGHGQYICTHQSKPILRHRLGDINVRSLSFGETTQVRGVKFSFHPAGHIVGSAQIRIEHRGEVWVVSGDYKIEDDGVSGTFEPIKCHTFITESTFGLPVYSWLPQDEVFEQINQWWYSNKSYGVTSILLGYSLGKAQRFLTGLNREIGPIYADEAVQSMNEVIRLSGVNLTKTTLMQDSKAVENLRGSLVITSSTAINPSWMAPMNSVTIGSASGWMQLRGVRRNRGADRGFILSDHADWQGLNQAIIDTGAEKIYVTHGYSNTLAKWLKERGINAEAVPK